MDGAQELDAVATDAPVDQRHVSILIRASTERPTRAQPPDRSITMLSKLFILVRRGASQPSRHTIG
jgi:hypothetical protein